MNDQKYDVLDSEESAIVDAVENGEYIAEKNPSKRIGELQAAAAATVKKKSITVRIQEQDIQKNQINCLPKRGSISNLGLLSYSSICSW